VLQQQAHTQAQALAPLLTKVSAAVPLVCSCGLQPKVFSLQPCQLFAKVPPAVAVSLVVTATIQNVLLLLDLPTAGCY
jgi:hypothetical protein